MGDNNSFLKNLFGVLFPSSAPASDRPEATSPAGKNTTARRSDKTPAAKKPITTNDNLEVKQSDAKNTTKRKPTQSPVARVSKTKTIVRHPDLGDITVSRTGQVRRISVSVRRDGTVRLNIPAGYPVQAGFDFLDSKKSWVEAALARAAAASHNHIIEPPYRTRLHSLEFRTLPDSQKVTGRITTDKIVVSFPEAFSPQSDEVQTCTRETLLRALRAEAKATLPAMVENIAKRHGFRYGEVTVRATHSRWGSCSGKNDISLSIFLMRLPDHLIEYVIIHELCHTVHKDHSARFHALADHHLGGREKALNAELRRYRPDII